MCRFEFFFVVGLGGAWDHALTGGLWEFDFRNTSTSAYGHFGARLLILKLGTWCVCFGRFVSLLLALVGGMWHDNTRCGLWYWNCNNASSVANGNIGARPLILKIGI